jgi:ATP-dependent Clp protease ATP-binding subunit ClpA
MLDELKNALKERDINFVYTEKAAEAIANASFSQKFGARNMRRYISREVEDRLADKLIGLYADSISGVCLDFDGESLKVDVI